MVKTPYVLARCTISSIATPVYCDGGEVDDTMKTDDEHHGGDHNRLSVTFQERSVKFKLVKPRDHMALNLMCYRSRKGESFTIIFFGEDSKGVFRALERLDGCVVPDRKRKFGSFKAVELEIDGSADNAEPILASYD